MDSARLLQGVSTVVELLEKRAREQADQLAFCFLTRGEQEAAQRTYGELKGAADRVAALLIDGGAVGERALLMYPPGLAFAEAFFGSLRAGTTAVPVPAPDQRGLAQSLPRLSAIAKDCGARFLLTTAQFAGMRSIVAETAPDLADLTWLVTDTLGHAETHFQSQRIEGSSLAFLQYTSGSTAAPRGVMVSHGNLLHNCALVQRAFEQDENSILVTWLPLHHDMGLIGCLLQPLYSGYPDYLMAPLDFIKQPARWLKAISKYRATISGGPNFAYELCVRTITDEQRLELDLSSWRIAFCGAEPVHATTLRRFADRFSVCGFQERSLYPCYGLAEATLIVTGGPKAAPPTTVWVEEAALAEGNVLVRQASERGKSLVSCGRADVGQEVLIVDPERLQPTSEVGEIWLKGPSVAEGYWNSVPLTEAVFGARTADGNGPYLRTGDLGFVLAGELYVCGRIKDLIIAFGKNHYPQDIEQTVHAVLPELRVGGVVAFSVPKDEAEALVIVVEAAAPTLKALGEELTTRLRAAVLQEHQLAVHDVVLARPGAIRRTTSGKLARALCRRDYLSDNGLSS
jgi:acyl-CoA synthetase (AMP-forming)/AMP-acid ligase II